MLLLHILLEEGSFDSGLNTVRLESYHTLRSPFLGCRLFASGLLGPWREGHQHHKGSDGLGTYSGASCHERTRSLQFVENDELDRGLGVRGRMLS